MMEFSVLMTVYFKDNPKFLDLAIKSILNQSLVPNEILIVKDGKLTEELDSVLEVYSGDSRIKVIGYAENKGLGLALNYGLEHCSFDIVARMDSDDICDFSRFEKQIRMIEMGFDLVGSNTIEFIDDIGNVISKRQMPETQTEIINYSKERNPFVHPSIMFRKGLAQNIGSYRNMYLVEDYDFITRMIMSGAKTYNIQENLVFMRVSKDFYARRGGWKYYKSIRNFFKNLVKEKYITKFEYLKTMIPRFIVYNSPNFVRSCIYKKKLRK